MDGVHELRRAVGTDELEGAAEAAKPHRSRAAMTRAALAVLVAIALAPLARAEPQPDSGTGRLTRFQSDLVVMNGESVCTFDGGDAKRRRRACPLGSKRVAL